jgi:hypothetical protein
LDGLFLQFVAFFSSKEASILDSLSNSKVDILRQAEKFAGHIIDVGGTYHEVSYIREHDFKSRFFPAHTCCFSYDPCCRTLVHNQAELENEWNAEEEPAITVSSYGGGTTHEVKRAGCANRTIHRFERLDPRWTKTLQRISKFRCKSCPYGSTALPHHNPTAFQNPSMLPMCTYPSRGTCHLGLLDDDILSEIASFLVTDSLISFGKAYPRLNQIVTSMHILIRRELTCFYLRSPLRDSVLGIGISIDQNTRTLSSDFDWLSYEAFIRHGVRQSVQSHHFQHFLPLAFCPGHFEYAYPDIWSCLDKLDRALREARDVLDARRGHSRTASKQSISGPHETVRVLYRMMNNTVVSLVKFCDDALDAHPPNYDPQNSPQQTNTILLHPLEQELIPYCHLLHLLLCLCRKDHWILKDAMDCLVTYQNNPDSLVKSAVPDLGELIICIVLVNILPPLIDRDKVKWNSLSEVVISEAITRNVRWVLQKSPELGDTSDQGPNKFRLNKTFENSRTSLQLMMFQVAFLDVFTSVYGDVHGLSKLDDNYGFVQDGMSQRMVEEIEAIYRVKSWPEFFARVKYEKARSFGDTEICAILREAVATSLQRGYHREGEFDGSTG